MRSPETASEYLAAASLAVRTSGGSGALEALGWWGLLPHLDDPDLRTAAFALFRAQGRELASSPALGGLLAQPYIAGMAIAPGVVLATVRRGSEANGPKFVVVGDPVGRQLLIDRPGHGAAIVGLDNLDLRLIELPGRLVVYEVTLDPTEAATSIPEPQARAARTRSNFLGRVALALEILGAAEGAVDLAIEYARSREQFGKPIGQFQAVRHLLAWASTDCTAVANVAREVVALDTAAPPRYDEVTKAIAGRNGRKACERALQVLGGIGFTAEHDHHHFHSRVLALDSLLGTSAELTHGLGAWLRTERPDPAFTSAILTGVA